MGVILRRVRVDGCLEMKVSSCCSSWLCRCKDSCLGLALELTEGGSFVLFCTGNAAVAERARFVYL